MTSIQLPSYVSESVDKIVETYQGLSQPQKVAVGIAGGLASLVAVSKAIRIASDYKRKPSAFELSGGSIEASKVASTFEDYSASYGADGTAIGIKDRSKTVQLVVRSFRSFSSVHDTATNFATSRAPIARMSSTLSSLTSTSGAGDR